MKTYLNSNELKVRIPFLLQHIGEDEMRVLAYKWGLHDNKYHSTKTVVQNIDTKFTAEQIKELETRAIRILDEQIAALFSCPSCSNDLRKVGVKCRRTGYQQHDMFITSDGSITRENHFVFTEQQYEDKRYEEYRCKGCNYVFRKENPVLDILTNGLNEWSVIEMLTRHTKINVHQVLQSILMKTKFKDKKAKDIINDKPQYIDPIPHVDDAISDSENLMRLREELIRNRFRREDREGSRLRATQLTIDENNIEL